MKLGILDFIIIGKTIILERVFETYLENESFKFIIQNVRNGDEIIQHEIFQLTILDDNYFPMNEDLATMYYQTTNNIYILNLTIQNSMVSTLTTYYFDLGFDLNPNQGILPPFIIR